MKKLFTLLTLLVFVSLTPLMAQPVLSLANAQTSPGSNVKVDLNVQNFTGVGAISLKIQYDDAKLNFIEATNITFTSNYLITDIDGIITIGWFDGTGVTPLNIDSGKLLELNFQYTVGYAQLNFYRSDCEIADNVGNPILTTGYVDGSISSVQSILLEENFDFTAGSLLTNSGWSAHSGAGTNSPAVVSPGLTLANYPSSGIGNAASLSTSGEDVNRAFTEVSSGVLYASILVNVTSAQTAGDYFFHFGLGGTTSIFLGRVFVKLASNGNLAFGLSKSSTSASILPVYSDSIYNPGTTYLLVLKYQFNPNTNDDVASLFINPNIASVEPAPTLSHATASANDPANLGLVALRQGSSANAASVIVDGIRVATTWSDIVPVELTSFTASVTGTQVSLNWTTATEVNNSGFEVQRSGDGKNFSSLGFIPGRGTTSEISNYNFVDNTIISGNKYYYRLKQIDLDGTFEFSKVVFADVTQPEEYSLEQNYPNPFNPSTTISFNLPVDAKAKVAIYDVLGKEIQQVVDNNLAAGNHVYSINLAEISSGVYFYRLEAIGVDGSKFSSLRKMILTK